MGAILKAMTALLAPIIAINWLGGIISGIWLAALGHWSAIGYGLLLLAFSAFGLGLALMPGLIFMVPISMFMEKGNKITAYVFGLLSNIYTYAILSGWCLAIMAYYLKQSDQNSIIPMLIWSYGTATGPIAWMARKDNNEYSMISTLFIEISYLTGIFGIILFGASLHNVMLAFGVIMSLGMIVQFYLAYLSDNSNTYYN